MVPRSANPPPLSDAELVGQARTHVVPLPASTCLLHPEAARAWQAMRSAARRAGLGLTMVSGFRDFEQQLAIWNGKFRGRRALLGREGQPLDALALPEGERVAAILMWSALPGASRHHWGSDCDVIDAATLPAGEAPRLLGSDFAAGGRHAMLADWLARHAAGFGFFQPYDRDRGGVQPEPWHLSYAPVAVPALARLSPALLAGALAEAQIDGRAAILERLPGLHARYVAAVAEPPPTALAAPLSRATRPA